MSLDIMRKKHTTIVGYGHGTGALAFLNYMRSPGRSIALTPKQSCTYSINISLRFGAHGYSTKQVSACAGQSLPLTLSAASSQAALTPPSSLNREAVKGFVFNSPFLDCRFEHRGMLATSSN